MPVEVIMPKVDMDMSSGKIAVWHVEEGAAVKAGDPLFDIETDKAAMEVESPASGTLHHILAEAGTEVAIGRPVAWVYSEGEEVGAAPANGTEEAAPVAREATAPPPPVVAGALVASEDPGRQDKARATPKARPSGAGVRG